MNTDDLYILASLVAQVVKRVPAMRETWVRSLGGEDPLEKEMATHSSALAWKSPWTESLVATVHGVAKSWTRLSDFTSLLFCSAPQLCLTLCDSTDCSTPGFPVLHYLLEFAQLMSIELMMPSIL